MKEPKTFHRARPFDLNGMIRGFAPIALGVITGVTLGFVLAVIL